jgi:hypothetical protein
MNDRDRAADLLTLIAQARRQVADDRYIWCSAADGFESQIKQRRGLLLGGALSPHFLREAGVMWSEIPWTVRLLRCRVAVCTDAAVQEPLAEWLPLLEGAAKAGETVLVVTETMGSEMLMTLVVNLLKGTLGVCAARPARTRYGHPEPGIESLGKPATTPPQNHERLPLVAEAWIRRSAAALFPGAADGMPSSALQDFAMIETGGENHEDQYDRLKFLMGELQKT